MRFLIEGLIMISKTYTIPLNPIPWKRSGLNGSMFFDKQKNEKVAVGLYLIKDHGSMPKFEGPLKLSVTFFMKQNKSVKERTKGPYCYKTPDLDNLVKFLCDSINDTDTIWQDDKQVADLQVQKIYDGNPRTVLIISELA